MYSIIDSYIFSIIDYLAPMFALLLCHILVGVIGVKPCGNTHEKVKNKGLFVLWGGPFCTQIQNKQYDHATPM